MNGERAAALIEGFPGTRVLSIGDVMLDEYVWGEVRRVSPEAPVPVVEVRRRSVEPGGAANTAVGTVALGGRAAIAGAVGDDPAAVQLRGVLVEHAVEIGALVTDRARPTTVKTRVVASNQQIVRTDVEDRSPLPEELEQELVDWLAAELPTSDAVILSDYGKGVVSPRLARQVIELAQRTKTPVVADPKGGDYSKYRGATVVTPNVAEAKRAAALDAEGYYELNEIALALTSTLERTALLITRGAEGMSLYINGEPVVDVPALAKDVFDVTGAGDTVATALALALGCGGALPDAALVANAAAGVVVAKVGTATPTLEEVRAATSRI